MDIRHSYAPALHKDLLFHRYSRPKFGHSFGRILSSVVWEETEERVALRILVIVNVYYGFIVTVNVFYVKWKSHQNFPSHPRVSAGCRACSLHLDVCAALVGARALPWGYNHLHTDKKGYVA